jgi:hypothetical protein
MQDSFAFTSASGMPAVTTKEEENAAQKLLANGNNTPITLSAIGVGLLALVTMLGVRMQRGLRPGLNDNIVEMKSEDSSINSVAFGEDISELKHGRIATLAALGFPVNVHPFRMGASWMFEADRVLGEWDPLNSLPSDATAECQPPATFFGVGASPAAPQPAVFFVAASSSESTSSSSERRRVVVYEDFGLLKGTPFDYGKEWSKEGAGPGGAGTNIEDCLTEATMETYMNKNGLRYKMNKTAEEREGLKLFGGLLPEIKFNVPFLNVDVNIAAPEVESIWEAIGFTATSNNARRVEEKQKAVAKEAANAEKWGTILQYWKEKYGYSKYYPGSWFYYDQLSSDPDENGRGQINTPADRKMSGFRMRKGGFYLDGTKDERK